MRRSACERGLPREQLVRHRTERVDVDAMVGVRVGGNLLGRHVGRGTERVADSCQALAVERSGRRERLGNSKVGDGSGATRDEHVVRLDVPVHDAVLVCVRERPCDVPQHGDGVDHRDRLAAIQPAAERVAGDVGHREVGKPVRFARREHRDDMRVLELRRDEDLAMEALAVDSGGEIGRENLDDDVAREASVMRDEHARHSPTRKLALEPVALAETGLEAVSELGHPRRSCIRAECIGGTQREPARLDVHRSLPCALRRGPFERRSKLRVSAARRPRSWSAFARRAPTRPTAH